MGSIARSAVGGVLGAVVVASLTAVSAAETQLCRAERWGENWSAMTIAELHDGRVVSDNLVVTYQAPFADLSEGDSILVEQEQTGATPVGELTVQYVGTTETRSGHVAIVVPAFTDGVAAMLGGLGGEEAPPLRHLLRWSGDGQTLLEAESDPPIAGTSGQAGSALNVVVLRWDDTGTAGAPTPVHSAIDSFVRSGNSAIDVFVDLNGERRHAGKLSIPETLMQEADAGVREAMAEQMAMIRENRCTTL